MDEEKIEIFNDLLRSLDKDIIKSCLVEYIKEKRLHSEYIDLITRISKDYIESSNNFIVNFKRNVNVLYVDKSMDCDVFKNVDINEKNWFWYARLLKCTEDEIYPKHNFLNPTYLLQRLKPIIADLNVDDLDDELKDLCEVLMNLYEKYGIVKEEE